MKYLWIVIFVISCSTKDESFSAETIVHDGIPREYIIFFPENFYILMISFKKVVEKLNEDSFPSVWNRFNLEFKSLNSFNFFSDFIVIDDEITMKIPFHYFFP